ncbi:MAG: hypothetical protein WC613_05890 [Candidatus Aenigmatarchaeota archaeon]
MDFLYPLRILAGRQLTRREIRWAQEGKVSVLSDDAVEIYRQRNGKLEKIYTTHNDDPLYIFISNLLGLYPPERETRIYTTDGRLTEVLIENHNGVREKTNYDPPGRFVGKAPEEKKAA